MAANFQMINTGEQQYNQAPMEVAPASGSGGHVGISTMVPNATQTLHNASFHNSNSCCAINADRKYLRVLENGIEANYPYGARCSNPCAPYLDILGDPGPGLFCPSTVLCPYYDHTTRIYFDRGPFDNRDCPHLTGCVKGDAVTFGGEIEYACCGHRCCDCVNKCIGCHVEGWCGERLRYSPFETCFCCCSNRTSCCDTVFCLGFGPVPGQPKFLFPLATCLGAGEGKKLEDAINMGRLAWKQRTGL